MSGMVQIALFFSFEVDQVPQVAAESPTLKGSLAEADTLTILRVVSRVIGQDLVPLSKADPGDEGDGSAAPGD